MSLASDMAATLYCKTAKFLDLDFGSPFYHGGRVWVKTRPVEHYGVRTNAFAVGSDTQAFFWHDEVMVVRGEFKGVAV